MLKASSQNERRRDLTASLALGDGPSYVPRGMKRVLFISPLFSPFQIEVGEALRALGGIDYRIAFGMRRREARRQPHWTSFSYDGERYRVMDDANDDARAFYADEIRRFDPDVLITGQVIGSLLGAILDTYGTHRYALAAWMEPPDHTRPPYYRAATRVAMRTRLALVDAVLAIGDRAEAYYRASAPHARVEFVPYGEDLSHCFAATPAEKSDVFTFLFSGQLRPHHNLDVVMRATNDVMTTYGAKAIRLVLAAAGPDQTIVDSWIERRTGLSEVVEYDREYTTWEDRLRPFRYSHALVYPCSYTGWGLVVPEAMAAGCIPITSRYVEASRFFVRHRATGIFIEPTAPELAREMAWCLENRDAVSEMSAKAREVAHDGDAPAIARRLHRALLALRGDRTRTSGQRAIARALQASAVAL